MILSELSAVDGQACVQPGSATVRRTTWANAMTIDVEDYFHVSAFESQVDHRQWGCFESRVCQNTERLLEIFREFQVRATFFVLGWVAERFPELVGRIAAEGHEVASHGYAHRLVYGQTPAEFRDDIRRARAALEAAISQAVRGYRAPSFSITARSLWALDILIEEGYAYDASIFPIHHDRYGIPGAPRHPYLITGKQGALWELPASTVRFGGGNFPIGGGGFFRQLPYAWTHYGIASVNEREKKPVIFYLHPWEIDADQPRLKTTALSHFRHYRNLSKTEPRLRRLLADFRFDSIEALLASGSHAADDSLRTPASAVDQSRVVILDR
jgi:polysaccharide deacetylase family protein (PEP-CTERM system associated)